jgi:glyoxylase-like metal-dependent hydrolase (beta-lactamase superfamily II)
MRLDSQVTTTDWFTTRQLDAQTWAIDDRGCDLIYLVCGEERALLIDTGWGVGDLPALAASLLDARVEGPLPLTVVNTHGHPDHTYGNGQFSEVYVSPADASWLRTPPPLENRQWIARDLLPRPLPSGFEVERWAARVPDSLPPVEDGQRFELGGRTLEAIALPGHSPGSICLLDRKMRRLFVGDSILTGTIWLHLDESLPLGQFHQNLQRIQSFAGQFDVLLPAHGSLDALPLPKGVLDDLVNGIASILNGERVGREESTFAGDGLRCDFGTCGVLYRPDRL